MKRILLTYDQIEDELRRTDRNLTMALENLAPWAADFRLCEGGYWAFESTKDALQWDKQS